LATFAYNNIHLQFIKTVGNHREIRYDSGNTYLWTEWTIHVRGIYNAGATGYTFSPTPGPGNAAPPVAPGSIPAVTDTAIRHALSQPRRKLVYTDGGYGADGLPALTGVSGLPIIVDAPVSNPGAFPDYTGNPANQRYLTDCNNGPVCLFQEISRLDAGATWFVEVAYKVFLNECYMVYTNPVVLLSHRWTQAEDIDQHGFARRRTRGHAVFRSDRLLQLRAKPDDFRQALAHPIPDNHQREGIRVTAHEDGNRLDYEFVDVEKSHPLLPSMVTRIDARGYVWKGTPSLENALGGLAGVFGGKGALNFGNVIGFLGGALPQTRFGFTIRVWGNRTATRRVLRNIAFQVLAIKFPRVFNQNAGQAEDTMLSFDLLGRYVDLQVIFRFGPITSTLKFYGETIDTKFPELLDDDLGSIATSGFLPGRPAVAPNGDNGGWGRGTSLAAIAAAGLASSCSMPGTPTIVVPKNSPIPEPG